MVVFIGIVVMVIVLEVVEFIWKCYWRGAAFENLNKK